MKSDIGALKAYMKMLMNGMAFSNWENKPNYETRSRLVESIMEGKTFNDSLNMTLIKKMIMESESEKELKRMLDDMLIKEEEFLV